MARAKGSVKSVRKGQPCGNGFERVTIKVGKRTIRACIRNEDEYKRVKAYKASKSGWFKYVMDTVAILGG